MSEIFTIDEHLFCKGCGATVDSADLSDSSIVGGECRVCSTFNMFFLRLGLGFTVLLMLLIDFIINKSETLPLFLYITFFAMLTMFILSFTKHGPGLFQYICDTYFILIISWLTYSVIGKSAGPGSPDYQYFYLVLFLVMILRLRFLRVIMYSVLLGLSTGFIFLLEYFEGSNHLYLFEYRIILLIGIFALLVVKFLERRHTFERKNVEKENLRVAKMRATFMQEMVSINDLIVEDREFQETLNAIGTTAKKVTGAKHLWVYLFPEHTKRPNILHLDPDPEVIETARKIGFVSGKLSSEPCNCQQRYVCYEKQEPYIVRNIYDYFENQIDRKLSEEFQEVLGAKIIISLPFMKIVEQTRYFAAITFVFQSNEYDLFPIRLFVNAFGTSIVLNQLREERAQAYSQLKNTHSELKETQSRLNALENSALIAGIAAGITHDINNPLGALKASVDLVNKSSTRLKKSVDGNENQARLFNVIDSSLGVIHEALDRINSVVVALKNFSQLDRARITFADINENIENVILLLQPRILGRVKIDRNLAQLPRIKCNPQEINQVAMNLILNAVEASSKGGLVHIQTIHHDGKVTLQISDHGTGIPQDIAAHIFEPAFTTKDNHAGMGLSLVKDIVNRHGGRIEYTSEPAKGSKFTIVLPAVQISKGE